MTIMNWNDIEHFQPHEFDARGLPGSGEDSFSIELAGKLDRFHEALSEHTGDAVAIIIHANGGYAVKGHSKNSKHYTGCAADLHAIHRKSRSPVSVIDQFLVAEKLECFGGIGLYPQWRHPGLHLDIGRKGRRWVSADGQYLGLHEETLKRCML